MASALSAALLLPPLWAAQAGRAHPETTLAREQQSLKTVCAKCHNLEVVTDSPRDYDAWRDTVQTMVDRGASGTDDQFEDIMDYLHRRLTTINVNSADANELSIVLNVPESAAHAIFARRTKEKLRDLDDLKSIPGVDPAMVDSKARLIFFN
jgi:competence protein ComEA